MGVRNIAVTITGDATSLSRALARGSTEVDAFSRKVDTTSRRTALSWQTAGLAVGAAVAVTVAGVTAAAVAAAQFETRMRNVNSITGASEAGLRKLSDATLDLSRKLPQSANTLAEGLYDIASSGFQGSAGLLVLQKSAEAASAGLSTTSTSAQAITAVLNAYGNSAASAGDVSDTLFQTVNLGVVSFGELAGVIGDVVGTAAAAKVNIQEVGAAIATMTLSGISGAEASTSLNRLLQALIQPSDALTTVYKQLGYESGAAALESKGLAGVMNDLRTATGGNITSLLQLFPEIRAARGALALMSDEGKTYARVSAAIVDENARQGATHRALAEQMKAASAQFTLLKNQATATAISIGEQVLPTFVALLHATEHLGSEAAPLLARGISAVTPLLHNLYMTGGDVVDVLHTLFVAVAPVGAAMAMLGGGAAVTGLTALSAALQAVTGFMAEHQDVVLALAAVYAATLLPSLAAVTIAFNRFILTPIILGLNNLLIAAEAGAGGLRTLAASMLTFQTVATVGVAVGIYAVVKAFSALSQAQNAAKDRLQASTKDFDALNTTKALGQIEDLRAAMAGSEQTVQSYSGATGTLRAAWNTTFGDKKFAKAAGDVKASSDAINELGDKVKNGAINLGVLSRATGVSTTELAKLARAQNIDLTVSGDAGGAARKQVLMYLQDMAKQSGTTTATLQQHAGMDIEAMQTLATAVADMRKQVSQAFTGATDILGTWKPGQGASEIESANKRIADSQQSLADLRARQATKDKLTIEDSQELTKAQQDVKDAQADLDKARQTQAEGTLEASYKRMITLGTSFSRDLQTAVERGLDPTVAAKLLQQGPEQAEPILQQLVGDHSGRLIKMVNDSERALQAINQQVVEQARLTALAVNSATDQLGRDLGNGMRIAAEVARQGTNATVGNVAQALGIGAADVARIAQEFGITLGNNVNVGVAQRPPNVPAPVLSTTAVDAAVAAGLALGNAFQVGIDRVTLQPPSAGLVGADRVSGIRPGLGGPRAATGGLIVGPGTGTSDSIIARVSNREYVQRRASVDYYGVDLMHRLNALAIPREALRAQVGFANGGLVRTDAMDGASRVVYVRGGAPQHSVTNRQDIAHVDVYGVDMDDALHTLERRRRQAALSGGARRP